MADLTCEHCGETFEGRRGTRWCSRRCRDRWQYANDPAVRTRVLKANREWDERNPEKRSEISKHYQRTHDYDAPTDPVKARARAAVRTALRNGKLKRGDCEIGGDCRGRIEAHHDDYDRPLDVRWLCTKHHGLIERTVQYA